MASWLADSKLEDWSPGLGACSCSLKLDPELDPDALAMNQHGNFEMPHRYLAFVGLNAALSVFRKFGEFVKFP